MKFAVAILAVLAVTSPLFALQVPASGSGALAQKIQYVFDVVPVDKILPILMSYTANETDVHAFMQILQSNEFKLFVQDVEAIPDVNDTIKYIQEAGLDIKTLKDKMIKVLDLDHISPLEASAGPETIPELKNLLKYVQEPGVDNITLQNRLNDFLDLEHVSPVQDSEDEECAGFSRVAFAFRNLVPISKYEERFNKMLKDSVFSDFIRRCNQLELRKIYLSFHSNEHYVKVLQQIKQADIFSTDCRGYYPLLMLAKIVLALAL